MGEGLPTILLLPGCFATPACFDKLVPYLHEAGYTTLTASYPSSNPKDPSVVTCQKDIDHFREQYLLRLVEKEHKDLVLAVHSFGAVVGGGAAVGLSKADRRARGESGGIMGLVYIAGNIVQENQTLIESAGGQWPPWLKKDVVSQHCNPKIKAVYSIFSSQPRPGVAIIDPVMETLYGDCDRVLQPELEAALTPHGYHCLETKASAPCWVEKGYKGRLAYVRTAQDGVNPAFAQDLWIESSGAQWDVTKMDASHGVFISQPKELAARIVAFAHKFEAL